MAAFYESALRLKPITRTRLENWVEFDAGGFRFALHAIPASNLDKSSAILPRESSPLKLTFEVDDLTAEVSRLEALGVTIVRRPWGTFDGIDPEGNIFHIASSQN